MSMHIVGVECVTTDYRASLTDDEFWPFVLGGIRPGEEPDEPDIEEIANQNGPCPECGEHGACAYDFEGRPMIHITKSEDEHT
ncbi:MULTISPECIES: hypothetical protein [unclassified Cryobacterium]|uniref:hypothetical protein n=1 Tax=unclassified Cryobacterium TaxID=2649013 RepID=UPI002AB5BA15|nr:MULTISPECIES: hypothetical protein [unclassified Cryobacterium]MDY7542620.1 hypothetical protein [Cryobacterium sp. 5B3]MEB0264740.1 hypothetical protein [Cryobacterium sp. 10I5]MEB0273712.1 hypothetical protein [Cryobacterium sp. 5B3]